MFYIHDTACISPQQTFGAIDIGKLKNPVNNKLELLEPNYTGIPPGLLRRMGKAVRAGTGAALTLMKNKTDGIILGTANGGMEDCIKFLNQIIDYKEGMLTPGNFVQSTANAIAGQLGMMTKNTGYNITHVHRAFAFENALLDAGMLLQENPEATYLTGGVDEISPYNYNIDYLAGWYKEEPVSNQELYDHDSRGSIAGEGAVMFLVNAVPQHAVAKVRAVLMLHEEDAQEIVSRARNFLDASLQAGEEINLLISGENGDNRLRKYYSACETLVKENAAIVRFKHLCGEYATASAFAVWLGCYLFRNNDIPGHLLKRKGAAKTPGLILVYNNYKGLQHSFILMEDAVK